VDDQITALWKSTFRRFVQVGAVPVMTDKALPALTEPITAAMPAEHVGSVMKSQANVVK
jgi:hypothetical protein